MKQANIQAPVALVTGAARRIGAAIAHYLHQAGFRVVIHYQRAQEAADTLVTTLNGLRVNTATSMAADLSIKSSAAKLITDSVAWGNGLNLLVNNAALFMGTDLAIDEEEPWDAMFTLNVKAPFWLSQAAYPYLAAQQGAIINITDIHADKPLKNYAIYCQSKAALSMQTKSLAREFAPLVRVNAVAPGAIAWPEHENALSPNLQKKIIEKTALKQHGMPIYVAQAVLALAENPFITGQTLTVDGGRALI